MTLAFFRFEMKNYKDVTFYLHKLKKGKFSIKLIINDYGIIKIWLTGSAQLSSYICTREVAKHGRSFLNKSKCIHNTIVDCFSFIISFIIQKIVTFGSVFNLAHF